MTICLIYARISKDAEGESLGVARQTEDCQALAAARGWTVKAVHSDNDISAFSGKKRPGYEALSREIEAGAKVVVAYSTSRVWRNRRERAAALEDWAKKGVRIECVRGPSIDLSSAAGRMMVGLMGEFDSYESDVKAERITRALDQHANLGRWGRMPPLGYRAADRTLVIVPEEAEIIQEAASRILSGESVGSVTRDFLARDIPTPRNGAWHPTVLRRMVSSPTMAGLRVHRGEVVARGQWEPILSESDHASLLALFDARRKGGRPADVSSLSSILICGHCGALLRTGSGYKRARAYFCQLPPAGKGCGRLQVPAVPIEDFVRDLLAARLDGLAPPAAEPLSPKTLEDAEEELADLARMRASGEIDFREWKVLRPALAAKVEEARKALAKAQAVPPRLTAGQFIKKWDAAIPAQRRMLASKIVKSIEIKPAGRGYRGPAEDRIGQISWV